MTEKITVHKTIMAETHAEFDVALSWLVAYGWKKIEATVFDEEGIHASLSADVDSLLLPVTGLDRVHLRAAEVFTERFSTLQPKFQSGPNPSPIVLPSGTLCSLRTVGKDGEFEYDGMRLELAAVISLDRSLPAFAVIRRAVQSNQLNISAYQL